MVCRMLGNPTSHVTKESAWSSILILLITSYEMASLYTKLSMMDLYLQAFEFRSTSKDLIAHKPIYRLGRAPEGTIEVDIPHTENFLHRIPTDEEHDNPVSANILHLIGRVMNKYKVKVSINTAYEVLVLVTACPGWS